MDNSSLDSIQRLKALLNERRAAQDMIRACRRKTEERATCVREEYGCEPDGRGRDVEGCDDVEIVDFASTVDPYVADVSFEGIPDDVRRRYFLLLPTTFSLDRAAVKALIEVGGELLARDPAFEQAVESPSPGR